MDAFSELVRVATANRRRRHVAPSMSISAESTYTGAVLHLLDCNGPMTTGELADAMTMHSKAVWGLLKGPRSSGQVKFDDGLWELDRAFPGTDVLRAVDLLRAKGWRLEPPQ